jgi:hypothetical protein
VTITADEAILQKDMIWIATTVVLTRQNRSELFLVPAWKFDIGYDMGNRSDLSV